MERIQTITLDKIKDIENKFGNEVKYSIDYFSVYPATLENYNFRQLQKTYGFIVLNLYCYLQCKMISANEYYIPFPDLDDHLEYFAFYNKVDMSVVDEVYSKLLEYDFITFLDTTNILGFSIITNSQVLYNYELINTKRKYERDKKRKSREKEKENKVIEEAPINPIKIINADDTFSSDDDFNIF